MTVSGTPGTGTITLLAAAAGFQTFASAGAANGDVISYVIEDGTNWEYGQGTYTSAGTTLARTTVQGSSNAGAAISATSSALVFASALVADIAHAGDNTDITSLALNKAPDVAWTIDCASCSKSVASGANFSLPAGSGKVIIDNPSNGDVGEYNVGGGNARLIDGGGSASFVATTSTPAAGKCSIAYNGGLAAYVFYSNFGSTVTFNFAMIRVRTAV